MARFGPIISFELTRPLTALRGHAHPDMTASKWGTRRRAMARALRVTYLSA
jgi:hypothetical protein